MHRLSRDDFQAWRSSPVTVMVRKYLKHLEDRQRQEWAQGLNWTPESQATVNLLSEIEDLNFEDIALYYGSDDETVDIPDEKLGLYPEEEDDEPD